MKIAHVIDYFHTDVGYQEYYLAKTQAEVGHDVLVVTSTHRHHTVAVPGTDEREGARALTTAGVQLVRLSARQLGHDRAWVHGIETQLQAFGPEAVHVHSPFAPTTLRVTRFCRQTSTPLLVDTHISSDIAPAASRPLGRTVYALYRALSRHYLCSTVGDWVANGPAEADFLAACLGVPREHIALVPLGFDPAVFAFDEGRRVAVRKERGWDNEVVVAVTGKLHPGKRPDLVAMACEHALRDIPVRLVMAGEIAGPYLGHLKARAPHLTTAGRFTLLPMLDRRALADLYLAADVVAFARLPSISIYEAAGTGARVILGESAFARWLTHVHRGIVPIPAEPEHLARSFVPPDDREALAREAEAAFSWQKISAHFVERYEALR